MAMKLLAEGNERLPTPLAQKVDEDVHSRRSLPLDFDEFFGALYLGDRKEFIKQAMLQHETIFQHQVLELHRLYWAQKNIVKDFYGNNRFHRTANCNANALPRETEMRFVRQKRVGSPEHQIDHHVFYKESMDPNLGAGENNNEMNIAGRYIPHERYHSNSQNLFDMNETTYSMSNEKGVYVSPSSIKTPMLCSVVALSDVTSCGRTSKDTGVPPAKLQNAGQDVACEIQLSTQSDTINRSSSQRAFQFDFDLNKVQLDESHAALDEPQCGASSASGGSSANSNGSTDESHFSIHSLPTCLEESKVDQAGVLKADLVIVDGKGSNNRSNNLCYQNTQGSLETNKLSARACDDGRYGSAQDCSIDLLESQRCCYGPSSGSRVMERSSNVSSSIVTSKFCKKYKDINSSSKLPILNTGPIHSDVDKKDIILSCPSPGDSLVKMEKDKRSEEDTLSSSTHGDGTLDKDDASAPDEGLFLLRGKSRVITRNDSCSMTYHDLTQHSATLTSENPEHKQMVQVIDVCDTFDDHKIYANLEMEKNEETQKALEMDPMVLVAAESLVDILVKDSSKLPQASQTKLDDILHEQPPCSSDSLESIVLAMKEIEMDEFSSPIWPTEKKTAKDDICRFKTRSGRLLRDFQKDVLPSLVSLSRHEICEDLHSFNEIMKSNDLNNKLVKPFKGSWSSTGRNRRSRLHTRRQRQ